MTTQSESSDLCVKCTEKCCKTPFGSPFILENELSSIKEYCEENGMDNNLKNVEDHYEFSRKDGNCAHLNDQERCEIYSSRPLDCKMYPVGITAEGAVGISRSCPQYENFSEEFIVIASKIAEDFSSIKEEYVEMSRKGRFIFK